MRRLRAALVVAGLLAASLAVSPAAASDAAAGLAPVGAIALIFGLGGGAFTTIVLAEAVADDQKVHPAVRNVGFAAGGVNLALGAAGITAAALVDDDSYDAVVYSVSGVFLALGLTGLGLSWAADEYDPSPNQQVLVPAVGPGLVGGLWVGTF